MLSLLLFICELLKCICNALQQAWYLSEETNLPIDEKATKNNQRKVDNNGDQSYQCIHVATPFLFVFIVHPLSSIGKNMFPGVTKHT